MQLQNEYNSMLLALQSSINDSESADSLSTRRDSYFGLLAYFEASMSQNQSNDIYQKLFDKGADFSASLYLNDTDYRFFVLKTRQLLEQYAKQDAEAWIELGLQHVLCRREHVNTQKASFYLTKAMDAGVPLAKPLYLYYCALGIIPDFEKMRAQQMLAALVDEGDLWAIAYYAHLEVWTDDFEKVPERIAPLKEQPEEKLRRHYYESQQFYLARRGDQEQRQAVLEEGIQSTGSKYCEFILTEIRRAQAKSQEELEALLPLYSMLFESGITDAAVQVALIKLGSISPEGSPEAAYSDVVLYLQKAWDYNNAYAGYRLASLYLYVDALSDVALGISLLEQAAAQHQQVDAQIELGEIYLEGRVVDRDQAKAFTIFQKLADEGIPYAQLRLGNFYEHGLTDQQADYAKAFALYKKAADANLPQAVYQVGRFIKYGIHTSTPDADAAQPYFEEAAAYDNALAIIELGIAQEISSSPSYQKAFEYFSRAAALGHPYAHYLKGAYLEYDYHKSGEKHLHEAFENYRAGADGHDIHSIYELARCYRFGIGTAGNLDQAIALYRQAAERNHAQALTDLALCYEEGYGVAKDEHQALQHIQKATDLGYAYARYVMGRYLLQGIGQHDVDQGLQQLHEAAEDNIAEAWLMLGDFYFFDYGERGQYEKGYAYYEKAQSLGHIADGLGMCYEFGVGVAADAKKAFQLYQEASAKGSDSASYRLGRCYYMGIGTDMDKRASFPYFEESAQQGNFYASHFAGLQLLRGDGVLADPQKGIGYIKDAANAGYAEAQFELGNCYLMGDAVEENEGMALHWFEQAAENGHEQARRIMKGARQ